MKGGVVFPTLQNWREKKSAVNALKNVLGVGWN
jgi:hypothetical protein